MMFIILLLIVAVAAFNIVSTLVMAVTDKQSDIAILRTLGASPGGIMKIFIVQGALIGAIGTLIGVAGGIALALNIDVVVPFLERLLNVQFLSREVYYITDLPSDLQKSDVVSIALVALALAFLATLYPSWRAAPRPDSRGRGAALWVRCSCAAICARLPGGEGKRCTSFKGCR